jgi:uncharacterized repeat protein (TIGR02543 family)
MSSLLLFTVCKVHGSGGDYKGGDGGEQVKVWKVTFNTDGGIPEPKPNPETVADGEAIAGLPPSPEKEGYTFGGWYLDLAGEPFDPETPVSENITLLAKWIGPPVPGHFHVTFDGAGGSPALWVKENVIEGGKIDPLPEVTRTGYTFGGWWTGEDGSGTPFTTETPVTGGATLYAKWTPVSYTVSYNANGGTGTATSSAHTYDVPKNLDANNYTRADHSFGGWAESADGAVVYADGQSVINLADTQDAAVTLYAKWMSDSLTLTNNSGGALLDSTTTYSFTAIGNGYTTAPAALTVKVTNTGDAATGALTASTDNGKFGFSTSLTAAITSVAAGSSRTFTVRPLVALGVGTHTATVTVSNSDISVSFNVSVEVVAPVYGITLKKTSGGTPLDAAATLSFPDATDFYATAPAALSVTVTNTGNTDTSALTASTDSEFTLSSGGAIASIAAGSTSTFTVRPLIGLGAGTHTAIVTVSGSNISSVSFNVSFEVLVDGWRSSPVWEPWPEDTPAPGVTDPVPIPSYPSAPPNTGGITGDVTITFTSDTQYTVTEVDGLSGPYGLADVGIKFDSAFPSDKRIIVDGANASTLRTPAVTITLDGVTITPAVSASPVTLQNGANVILVLAGTNTLTATTGSFAGLEVPANNKITIIGSGALTATNAGDAAGIGSHAFIASGTISIGGNAQVTAIGGRYSAALGAGWGGACGTITIGGSAKVMAKSTDVAGIGGSTNAAGGAIIIGGSAQVAATGGGYGAGIGGGRQAAGGTVEITGNTRVYAKGGGLAAGIGGSYAGTGSVNITIGTGTDYPVVIAYGGADGIGNGGSSSASSTVIIKSGFVAARAGADSAYDIGNESGSVTITGGSVYPYYGKVAAPTNGGQAVYPLYVPVALMNSKTISVPAFYATKTIGKSAARFLATGLWTPAGPSQFPATAVTVSDLTGLLSTSVSATLWLPANTYTGITVDSTGNYGGTVTPAQVPYTTDGDNRLE